jgi:hypothetical protein
VQLRFGGLAHSFHPDAANAGPVLLGCESPPVLCRASVVPARPLLRRQRRSRRLPPDPAAARGPAGPSRAAACSTVPRRCGTSQA